MRRESGGLTKKLLGNQCGVEKSLSHCYIVAYVGEGGARESVCFFDIAITKSIHVGHSGPCRSVIYVYAGFHTSEIGRAHV